MNILYHITNLPPKLPNTEASLQELNSLKAHFGGKLVYLNPNEQSPIYLPRLLFGFHKLKEIRAEEASSQVHHLYNADPFPFPVLRWLRQPIIYSISSGVGNRRPNISFFNSLAAVTVSDARSLNRLEAWGLTNCHLVRPGIDAAHFAHTPLSIQSEFRVMVGSAPWMQKQFHIKGIDALLAAARQAPHLRLVFLWRGVLIEEIERRVRQMNLEKQVEIVNRIVNVNQMLATVHASITLVTDPTIIRSYPHSLMESLAAGKPVIVSRSIPMADYVERTNCGTIVENITPGEILTAVEELGREYEDFQASAQRVGKRDFSRQALIESFQNVYDCVVGKQTKGDAKS
jgi:glycosyltransferase involved in cell wall biosynthesis